MLMLLVMRFCITRSFTLNSTVIHSALSRSSSFTNPSATFAKLLLICWQIRVNFQMIGSSIIVGIKERRMLLLFCQTAKSSSVRHWILIVVDSVMFAESKTRCLIGLEI